MKHPIIAIFLLGLFSYACQPNNPQSISQEDQKLLEKYKKQEEAIKAADLMMQLISESLDSINLSQLEVNELINREKGAKKEDVLDKIDKLKQYVKASNERINDLERLLAESRDQNQQQVAGLMAVINKLKSELKAKEDEINELKVKVAELTDEVVNLKGKIELQQVAIGEKEEIISQQQNTITNKDKTIQDTEKEVLNTRIEKLLAQGQGQEDLAAKTNLAAKKKAEYLTNAYNYYTQARNLCSGRGELSNKQREIENKMAAVKEKMRKKDQEGLQ